MHMILCHPPTTLADGRGRATMLAGGLIWLATVTLVRPELIDAFLLLAVSVLLPAGLGLHDPDDDAGLAAGLGHLARGLHLPAAGALAVSLALPPGGWAGGWATPWLATTAVYALASVMRPRQWTLAATMHDVAEAFLVVAGAWTVISRAGLRPLGFDPVIVQLTPMHFHYAGYILPLIAGLATARLNDGFSRWSAIGTLVGVPATAVGITLGGVWELMAALLLVATASGVAGSQLRLARHATEPRTLVGLSISGAALLAAMALAASYALGQYGQTPWLTIPQMAIAHGALNAFGFAGSGLWAWRAMPPEPQRRTRQDAE